jgi:protein subunit release factor A
MSTNIEVRAGDGGDDAALFATQLASAIAAHTGGTLISDTEVSTQERL